jgi:ABC-type cobalamin/Fe3+-siderophores transport system ATPase subunit
MARAINQTLCTMNLGAVRSQRIGDVHNRVLSGGEVKRVSIAKEFVARPSVLVMDGECLTCFHLVQHTFSSSSWLARTPDDELECEAYECLGGWLACW